MNDFLNDVVDSKSLKPIVWVEVDKFEQTFRVGDVVVNPRIKEKFVVERVRLIGRNRGLDIRPLIGGKIQHLGLIDVNRFLINDTYLRET